MSGREPADNRFVPKLWRTDRARTIEETRRCRSALASAGTARRARPTTASGRTA